MAKQKTSIFNLVLVLLLFSISLSASYPEYFNRSADKKWSQAKKVVRALGLRKGQIVADIGAGGGYFSVLLARTVGASGRVYAVDISRTCIRYIRQYAKRNNVRNVVPVLATENNPGLKKNSIDLIFIRNTYHHIGSRVPYFCNLKKVLKPGGRVVIIDYHPHVHPRHSTQESIIYGEMSAAGYRRHARHTFLTRQNFNIFKAD